MDVDAGDPWEVRWNWARFGSSIGLGLLEADDLDGDGQDELIFTGGGLGFGDPQALFVLESDLQTVSCVLENPFPVIRDYLLFQADDDSALEVLIATNEYMILVDGASCEIQDRIDFPTEISYLQLGDVNDDGTPDIAYSLDDDLFVAPWNNLEASIVKPGFGGFVVDMGPLSRSDGEDILLMRNKPGTSYPVLYLLKGDTLEVLFEHYDIGRHVGMIGEFDGDPEPEIAISSLFGEIEIYNFQEPDPLPGMGPGSIGTLAGVQDVNNDGIDEFLYYYQGHGGVGVKAVDGSEIQYIDNPAYGVTDVLAADLDGNGSLEIFWGGGHRSTGSDHLFRADLQSGEITWESQHLDPRYMIEAIDGQLAALLFQGTNSGYGAGGIVLLNRMNGTEVGQLFNGSYPASGEHRWTAMTNGGDPQSQRLCSAFVFGFQSSGIRCYDSITFEELWSVDHDADAFLWLHIDDINQDNQHELIALRSDGILFAYSVTDGSLLWESGSLDFDAQADWWAFENVANFGGEIWIFDTKGNLRVLDPTTGSVARSESDTSVSQIQFRNDVFYAARLGEGVGIIDPNTLAFDEMIYETPEFVGQLELSEDGKYLFVGIGEPPLLKPVILSLVAPFAPLVMNDMKIWDVEFMAEDELLLASPFGAVRIALGNLDIIRRDRFECSGCRFQKPKS